jgi:photosystem II stability/assembly factor-like uncharacterized protein
MSKKIILTLFLAVLAFGLTGCISFGTKAPSATALLGVFTTENRGDTWVAKNSLMTPGATAGSISTVNILMMAQDPSDPAAMYLGTRADGILYTYNSAAGWNKLGNLTKKTTDKVYAITVDPKNKCAIFAGVGNKIWKSIDCGRTWDALFNTDKTTELIRSIIIDWYDDQIIYMFASDGSMYKSLNNGVTWARLADFQADIEEVEMDNKDSRVMYVCTKTDGLYRSVDAGVTWTHLKDQLKGFGSNAKKGYGLELARDQANTLYYISKYGLLKSTDSGETWVKISLLSEISETTFSSLLVDPLKSSNIYYTDDKTLYRTSDGGATWETKKLPSTSIVSDLKINPKDSNILYITFKAPEQQ